jgi:hypothetical protein
VVVDIPFVHDRPLGPDEPAASRVELDVLLTSVSETPGVCVHAPPGYGKTTLLLRLARAAATTDAEARLFSCGAAGFAEKLLAAAEDDDVSSSYRTWILLDDADDLTPDGSAAIAAAAARLPADRTSYVIAGVDPRQAKAAVDALIAHPLHRVDLVPIAPTTFGPFLAQQFRQHELAHVVVALDELIEFGGGHPQRTMLLAHCMSQNLSTGMDEETAWQMARDSSMASLKDHFEQVWSAHSSRLERAVVKALVLSEHSLFSTPTLAQFKLSKAGASRARDRLLASGDLVRDQRGALRLADPLFAEWIREKSAGTASHPRDAASSPSRRRTDRATASMEVAPFGNPDAARADLSELRGGFLPLTTPMWRTGDRARVIVGRKGSGKTLYLRTMQAAAALNHSIYADAVSVVSPSTHEVARVSSMYPAQQLVEAWARLWRAAILRAVTSHLLNAQALRNTIDDGDATQLRLLYSALGRDSTIPRPIAAELNDVLHECSSLGALERHLTNRSWDELEYHLAHALKSTPPVWFWLDALDEEFEQAPAMWLACQKGLFYETMRLTRDPRVGARVRVTIAVRDLVFSSLMDSEHATRYSSTPLIRRLNWDFETIRELLRWKVSNLSSESFANPEARPTVANWLGVERVETPDGASEDVESFILRHTRLLPRDIVILGNDLHELVSSARARGEGVSQGDLLTTVRRAAALMGNEQVAISVNRMAADFPPPPSSYEQAPYSGIYGASANRQEVIRSSVRRALESRADSTLDEPTLVQLGRALAVGEETPSDVLSILWQAGLLGYVNSDGERIFYGDDRFDDLTLERGRETYVFHTVLKAALR